MLDRCCVICYNNRSLKMKGVLEMKVSEFCEKLLRCSDTDSELVFVTDTSRLYHAEDCDIYLKVFGANTDRLIIALDGDLEGH